MKRGRPKVYANDEERKAARRATMKSAEQRSIVLDAPLMERLAKLRDRMELQFGFRPSPLQALHFLLKDNKADHQ